MYLIHFERLFFYLATLILILVSILLFAFLLSDLHQKWHLYQLLKSKENGGSGLKLLMNITTTRQQMQVIARNIE